MSTAATKFTMRMLLHDVMNLQYARNCRGNIG